MPTARKPFVGGNWKMNVHRSAAIDLAKGVADAFGDTDAVDVAVFPAFPYLATVSETLCAAGSQIMVGAQDFYTQDDGAFTGEVSVDMLKDVGCRAVLVGHSERRHVMGEGDVLLNEKVHKALGAGLHVVLCVGEKLEQRETHQTDAINVGQLGYGLAGVSTEDVKANITVAYEPVWAIGTGKTASRDDAQSAHAAIRDYLKFAYSDDVAQAVRIQYGGSCKPGNAAELFSQTDIDGGLIGGASLKPDDFAAILSAAKESVK